MKKITWFKDTKKEIFKNIGFAQVLCGCEINYFKYSSDSYSLNCDINSKIEIALV